MATNGEKAARRERLATVVEVAEHLAMARSSIYALMDQGTLAYVKIGRCRRVPWAAVEELVARNTVGRA